MKELFSHITLISILSGGLLQQGVYVTFKNDTKESFKQLRVHILGQQYSFKDLKSGDSTQPINVEKTYRFCYAEAITATDTFICKPTDYYLAPMVTSGRITMCLDIIPEAGKYGLIIKP